MGRVLRTQKKVDYRKVVNKYDKHDFIARLKHKPKASAHSGLPGRARSAPPITRWPCSGMHFDVEYCEDIDNDFSWKVALTDEVRLPFSYLDVKRKTRWQGLIQTVDRKSGDAHASDHFDELAATLRTSTKNTVITECVGEAAAAICMLTDFTGFEMIWGFHLHSGTGIDQIWRKDCGSGIREYLIVEAKGPGAGLTSSPFLPPDYNQMEEGWVINHLYSMDRNNHAAGQEIVAALGLAFTVAHANFAGASKSYHGLALSSQHKTRPSKLWGMVVQAKWLSDGRLGYTHSSAIQYLK